MNKLRMNSFLLFLAIYFLEFCTHNKDNRFIIERSGIWGSEKFAAISLNQDTILDGKAQSFYLNGRLRQEVNFKNDVKEGEQITYDTNRIVKRTENFKNGILEGVKAYFTNGRKDSSELYHNGATIARRTFYPSGSIQSTTAVYSGVEIYRVTYDDNGNKLTSSGTCFVLNSSCFEPALDSIIKGKSVKVEIPSAEIIGGYTVWITASILQLKSDKFIQELSFQGDEFGAKRTSFLLNQPGLFDIYIYGEMSDSLNHVVRRDSTIQHMLVR